MTRSSMRFWDQRRRLRALECSSFKATKQALPRIIPIFLLATMLNPLLSVSEAGFANAQSTKIQARRASDYRVLRTPSRKRVRERYKVRPNVRPRQKKSFLSGLFGSKPVRQKRSKPFKGLKSFFEAFQAPVRSTPGLSLRETYEQRMTEAAKKDALIARQRRRSGFFGGGFDPARGDPGGRSRWGKGRYRTMCVRMCDGYYFPVSFKANSRQFESDEHYCNSNCYNAPTKLFYYSNPGGEIEDMRSIDGTLYRDIANAFKYRKEYVADCRCKAEPWSSQARQQHESWGLEAETKHEKAKEARESGGGPNWLVDDLDLTNARQAAISLPYERY